MSLVGEDNFGGIDWSQLPVVDSGGSGSGTAAANANANTNKKTLAWQIWKDAEDGKIAAEALGQAWGLL